MYKGIKRIISVLVIVALLAPSISGCINNKKADAQAQAGDYITRAEWVTILGKTFGMDTPVEEECAYTDIDENSELFNYVQACYEWGVLSTGTDKFKPDDIATVGFVVSSSVLAAELDYSKYATSDDVKESIINCADKTGLLAGITYDEKVLSQGIDIVSAAVIADTAKGLYSAANGEEKCEIDYVDNVVDLSTLEEPVEVSEEGKMVMDEIFAADFEPGDVVILPPSEEYPTGRAVKVDSITVNPDGTYDIQTVEPEFYEVFEELDVVTSVEALPEHFTPVEGVTVIEDSETDTMASVMPEANFSTLENKGDTPEAEQTKKADFSAGKKLKLEVGLDSDGKLTFSKEQSMSINDFETITTKIGLSNKITEFDEGFLSNVQKAGVKSFGKVKGDEIDKILKDYEEENINQEELREKLSEHVGTTEGERLNITTVNAKYSTGWEIKGTLEVETNVDVVCKVSAGFIYVSLDSYAVEVDTLAALSLTLEGKLEGDVTIGTYNIPVGSTGISVKLRLGLFIELNGSITLKVDLESNNKFEYDGDKTKKTCTNDIGAGVEASVEIQAGPMFTVSIAALGFDIMDVQLKAAVLIKAEAGLFLRKEITQEDNKFFIKPYLQLTSSVSGYAPIITLEIGTGDCLLGKLGLSKEWELVGEEDAKEIFKIDFGDGEEGYKHYFDTITIIITEEPTTEEPTTEEPTTEEPTTTEDTTLENPTNEDETVSREDIGNNDTGVISLTTFAEVLSVGDKYTVGVESLPQGYVFTDLVWSSDNTACATVNSNGVVTAVSSDSAVITVSTSDGKYKASVTILVE